MGISRGAVKLIGIALGAAPQRGKVITFGVQKIECTRNELLAQLKGAGIKEEFVLEQGVLNNRDSLHQQELFSMLGFETTDSIDYYADEEPSFLIDLNNPVPSELAEQYDLVYDGGTMEHCFDPAQVMANAMQLAKIGGRVIHHVPMNNWVDHGFYQFSPTLFFDSYSTRGFEDMTMTIHFKGKRKELALNYDPRQDPPIPYATGLAYRCLIFFTARKTARFNSLVAERPIQGRYRVTFGDLKKGHQIKKALATRLNQSLRKRFLTWYAKSL